jgi:hypothetical protein
MKRTPRSRDRTNYEVGYGRPPRAHQFKKGQRSANPSGRPRGSRNPNLSQVLLEPLSIKVQGRTRKVPFLEAWAQVVKDKAIKGDIKAGQMLLLLAKQLNMLNAPDFPEDEQIIFTLDIGKPPAWLNERKSDTKEGQ